MKDDPVWFHKLEGENCPGCGHGFLVAVESAQDIQDKTKRLEDKYDYSLCLFKKGMVGIRKPKTPKEVVQHIVCMCCVSKCHSYVTGKGCLVCMQLVETKKEVP